MIPRYKVNEIFDSIQGEGILTGLPSTFVRLQGCPVGCSWCDSGPLADEIEGKRRTNGMTANTWGPGGEWMDLDEIDDLLHAGHVIITGGEPTIWNLDPLLNLCDKRGKTTQLETSGLQELKGNRVPNWTTWSPKQNLGFQAPMAIKNLAAEVKFVIDNQIKPGDIQKAVDYMYYERRNPDVYIVLMPEGTPPGTESIERAKALLTNGEVDYHGLPARFGWRLQYTLGMR